MPKENGMDDRRLNHLLAALALGPLAVIPAMISLMLVIRVLSSTQPNTLLEDLVGGAMLGAYGLGYAYPITLFYGLPIFLLLKWLQSTQLWRLLLASLAPLVLIGLYSDTTRFYATFAGYFAVWVAITCWVIAVYLPDRAEQQRRLREGVR